MIFYKYLECAEPASLTSIHCGNLMGSLGVADREYLEVPSIQSLVIRFSKRETDLSAQILSYFKL